MGVSTFLLCFSQSSFESFSFFFVFLFEGFYCFEILQVRGIREVPFHDGIRYFTIRCQINSHRRTMMVMGHNKIPKIKPSVTISPS